ncbi:MAG: hypothetical protein AAGJ70_09085 [Pseudomonadota bacterium]
MSGKNNAPWSVAGFYVDDEVIRTRRTSIATEHVDLVDIRRPLLGPGVATAVFLAGLAMRFGDLLTGTEITSMAVIGCLAICAGSCLARLKLQSFSIRDVAIFLPIWIAQPMRVAIDQVLKTRRRTKAERRGMNT